MPASFFGSNWRNVAASFLTDIPKLPNNLLQLALAALNDQVKIVGSAQYPCAKTA